MDGARIDAFERFRERSARVVVGQQSLVRSRRLVPTSKFVEAERAVVVEISAFEDVSGRRGTEGFGVGRRRRSGRERDSKHGSEVARHLRRIYSAVAVRIKEVKGSSNFFQL